MSFEVNCGFISLKNVISSCSVLKPDFTTVVFIFSILLRIISTDFSQRKIISSTSRSMKLSCSDNSIKIFCLDKPINLEDNLNILKGKCKNSKNKKKQKLLDEDFEFISSLNTSKSVVNREFYLIVEEINDNEKLLNQKLTDLIQDFTSIGLNSERIKSEEWRDILYVMLNPVTSLDIFKKDATGITRSFKEKIAPNGLKISEKELMLGDAYVSVVTLVSYPSIVNVGCVLRTYLHKPNQQLMLR